jgi:hypothetical protein
VDLTYLISTIEKLSGQKLSLDGQEAKINLGEISQKQNLKHILDFINHIMDIHPLMSKWKVEGKESGCVCMMMNL